MRSPTSSAPSGWYGIVIGLIAVGWNVYNALAERKRKVLVQCSGWTNAREDEPTVFVIGVSIVNDSPRRSVVITGYELVPPWSDKYVRPFQQVMGDSKYHPWSVGPPFPREHVLNHRVKEEGKLASGDLLTGTLLFRGTQPIPVDMGTETEAGLRVHFAHGKIVSAKCRLGFEERRWVEPSGDDLLAGRVMRRRR
jgi:hypothetical protein